MNLTDAKGLDSLVAATYSGLKQADIDATAKSKHRVAAMYDDHGDTVVQQNMVVHNLESDMY